MKKKKLKNVDFQNEQSKKHHFLQIWKQAIDVVIISVIE